MKRVRKLIGISFLLAIITVASSAGYAQEGDINVHDPVMIRDGNTYYVFHTGWGISVKRSDDLRNWESYGQVFENPPEWALQAVDGFRGHIWAPDISYRDGQFYLYYSVSAFGRNTSAIGVATNTTLNREDPEFEWVDHGMVVESVPGRDLWNAIDPNLAFDEDGTPWLTFGSFWLGIKMVKLKENLTVVATDTSLEWYTVAARYRYWKLDERDAGDTENSGIEAPFIFRKNGYYYLLVSWDRCCAGEESTYKVVVGRSRNITGPYIDRANQNMLYGGGTLVVKGNEVYAGVGHCAAYTFNGIDYLVAHAYDLADDGRSKLIIMEIKWDDDGWPHVSLD